MCIFVFEQLPLLYKEVCKKKPTLQSPAVVPQHKEKIKCLMCKMKYSNLPDMRKHMKIHSKKQAISSEGNPLKKRRRSVKQLNENLSVADLLNEEDESIDESAVKDTIDIEAVPGYSKFGCAFCVSEFRTEEELGTHEKNNHEIKCGECNYLSVTKDDLSRHKDIEHNTKVRCEYCGSEYEFEQELEFHIRDAHTKIEYSCDKCGFKTKIIESIAEHSNLCDKKKLEVPIRVSLFANFFEND